MQCFNDLQKLFEPTCVAVGCFDGIHLGHQKIISDMCSYAKNNGLKSAVFTFIASPAAVLGKTPHRALMSQKDKMKTLEMLGVDYCFSLDFLNVMNITPIDYIEDILINKLSAKAVFCGFNYRFGKSALGDTSFLKDVCDSHSVETFIAQPVCFGESVVSSSRIRGLIENGDLSLANTLLGRPFAIEEPIIEGKQNGRKVGIPTVNQNPPPEFVTPKYGVYASYVYVNSKRYEAITNVGTRPTVGGDYKNFETHIIGGFSEELYGQIVRTELLDFVRCEQKFDNLQQLSEQIQKDIRFIYDNKIYENTNYET